MLSWLRGVFRGEQAPPTQRGVTPPTPGQAAPQAAVAPKAKARDDAFWEQLRSERGTFSPLSPEDDELVSQLVLQVLARMNSDAIDPPPMPALAPRILEVVRKPEAEVAHLVRVIEQDQAISAKLMSVANSAAFGLSRQRETLREAITYMGVEQTAQIAIALATRSLFDADGRAELSMYRGRWSRLFQHSMTTAFAASNLMARKFRRYSDEAFLGGLFHDVGKTVALRAISALTLEGQWETPSEAVMDEVLYRIHAFPGAEFYDRWTLPGHLMQICCDHHQLDNAANAPNEFYVVSLVSAFDALRAGSTSDKRYALDELTQSAEQLSMADPELRAAHTETAEFALRVSKMF